MVRSSLRPATGVLLALACLGRTALAQVPPPGRAHLFVLDLSGTPVGEFPTSIKQLKGSLEVALKDGVPMLKASVTSEFLITLPQALPTDFTLEFDLVPKGCCNPSDLSFEGTPTINQGAGSAHVLWDSDGYLAIIGGGGATNYEAPMPEDLRATLPGVLTNVVAVVQGPTIRLYTNGRRHYTLDKNFARGRVLRVTLGVDLARQDPVHLAGLRILAGAVIPTGIVQNSGLPGGAGNAANQQNRPQPGLPSGSTSHVPPSPGTASQSQASTGGSIPTTVSNVSVTQGTTGPVVSWQPVSVAAGYLVRRWKIDDVNCCSNASPAGSPLAGPPWQDASLPVPGTYVYEVTATMSGGVATGQVQFVHVVRSGQIATVAAPPPPPILVGAPIATSPRTGGTSSLRLGPATLSASPRSGWGVVLQWPEVVGAAYYQVERGATTQGFSLIATLDDRISPPQAGTYSREDVTVLPGSTTYYRVKAVFLDGTSALSPVTRYDVPTHVAQISNLKVAVTGPCDVTSPSGGGCTPPRPGSTPFWRFTWTWDPVPGALTYETREEFLIDPAQGFIMSTGGSIGTPSRWQNVSAPRKQTRFCVSLIRPVANVDPITNGTCLVTDTP